MSFSDVADSPTGRPNAATSSRSSSSSSLSGMCSGESGSSAYSRSSCVAGVDAPDADADAEVEGMDTRDGEGGRTEVFFLPGRGPSWILREACTAARASS